MPNVACKISGLITQADWVKWTASDFKPYVDYVIDEFGPGRVMFGSDWPILTQVARYENWMETILCITSGLHERDQNKLFYKNAMTYYRLD
jgi:L-fuconolactonase